MKRNANRRILLIVLAFVLLTGLALGTAATALVGDVNGDGKVSAFDAQMILESQMGLRELTVEQQSNQGGLSFQDIVNIVLNAKTKPQDPSETEPVAPNAIAAITNGSTTTYVTTVQQIVDNVEASGNTQITLLKDISNDGPIVLPYSCSIDCAGYTISTDPTGDNGLQIVAAGSENQTTTVKNGTLVYYDIGIRVDAGAIIVDGMTMRGQAGACVGLYDTTAAYKDINCIKNSTLSSAQWGCISYNAANSNFNGTGITVENTTMVSYNSAGVYMLSRADGTVDPGTVTFGYNVHMYSYKSNLAAGGYTLAYKDGLSLTRVVGTAAATVGGVIYENMTCWSTPAPTVPDEDAEPIATVTNGTETTNVTTVADMVSAVSSTGNTQITLLQDISTTSAIILSYSCTLDLNGHTITTNLSKGNGLQITAAGTENQTTTVKNGTLVHYEVGVRVAKGAVVIDNMQIESHNGPCVALYDASAEYKSINSITNSALTSPYACVAFNAANTDFSTTGITIASSELISHKNADGKTSSIFVKASGAVNGSVIFGQDVNMYAYNTQPVTNANSFFNGNVITKTEDTVTVSANGVTYENINCWTTELEPIKILCIGNSFNLRLVQEVYGLAAASGREIYLTNLYYGGCSVERHWKSLSGDWSTEYAYWITSSLGRSKHGTITTIQEAIEYQDWDIITLQQHFDVARAQTYETAVASCTPYVENMYTYLRSEHPNAQLYWYQTWAYAVGYTPPEGNSALPCPDVATQTNQQEQIIAASNWISQTFNVPQIPCGSAWKITRANPDIEEDPCLLSENDYCHDGNVNGGQYLNACVWFETLFQTSCLGNSYDPSENDSYTLDVAFKTQLQEAAHQAVADMYGEDYAK